MKKGKELKLDLYDNYNIVMGSVDNKNSKAVYINLSAWGQPMLDEELDYTKIIRSINKVIKKNIYDYLNVHDNEKRFYDNRSIVDLDIRKSGIKFNKRSFSNTEITLFLTEELPINSDKIKPIIDGITNTIVQEAFEKNKFFSFHKKKN